MNDEEISGLKEEHRQQVLNGNFEKAKITGSRLQTKLKEKENLLFERYKKKATTSVKAAITQYKNNLEIINSSFDDIEISVRQRCDLSFQNAQAIHIRELIELEKSFAVERMRAKNRLVKDTAIYQKQAVGLMKMGDKEGAETALQNADESQEKEQNRRIMDINKAFDAQRKSIFEKQKNELRILDEKLVNNLQQVQQTKEIQINSQQSQLRVLIQGSIRNIIDKIPINTMSRKQKAELSKELHSYAQTLVENELNVHLNLTIVPEPVNPKRNDKSLSIDSI